MVEVYLLGVFVAYVKLVDLVHIEIGLALYALCALMLTMVAADAVLDRQAVWEAIERGRIPARRARPAAVARRRSGGRRDRLRGLRPASARPRRAATRAAPAAARTCMRASRTASPATWALVIAAAILYVPANIYPVLTVIQLGSGAPSTILGGVEELLAERHVSAGAAGVLRQHRGAGAQADRARRHAGGDAGCGSGRPAAGPHAAYRIVARDRPLVDDRHLHGIDPGRAGAVRRGWSPSTPASARSPSPAW